LTLQRELRESLSKSRERLARLTTLEQLDHESHDDIASYELSAISEESHSQLSEVREDMPIANPTDCFDVEMDQNNRDYADGDDVSSLLPTTAPQIRSLDVRIFNQRHVLSKSLMTFLPSIGSSLLGEIIRLSMREANALDESSGTHSCRRSLLWNTCLDFGLLTPTDGIEAHPPNELLVEDLDIRPDQSLDPNVLLCPYELAGVCADECCPYQHSTKQTLSREKIPLPSLSLRPKQDSPPEGAGTSTSASNGQQAAIPKPELVIDVAMPDTPDDMDFIALPRSESEYDNVTGNSVSENDEDDDDNDVLLGLSNPATSSSTRLLLG
jgi:hypothetical protein